MDVRDNWSTEYNRKGFSVTIDETDWRKWVEELGLPAGAAARAPLAAKGAVMRQLAYAETARAAVDWAPQADPGFLSHAVDRLAACEAELGQLAGSMKGWWENVTAAADPGSEAGTGQEPGAAAAG